MTYNRPVGSNSGTGKTLKCILHWLDTLCMFHTMPESGMIWPSHYLGCRRPTFSETKRVLYSLLSVFEPSSHALQALKAPTKPAAPKPPKHSPQKAAAVVAEPEPQPVKVSGLASHHMLLRGLIKGVSMHRLQSSKGFMICSLVTYSCKGKF